jgi:hypothetical protein
MYQAILALVLLTLAALVVRIFFWNSIEPILAALASWVRYLYFLRFSILLWSVPFGFMWLNSPDRARALTSGIVTPSTLLQYLCVGFFLVGASFVALILARIVAINGSDRFGEAPPELLRRLLASNNARHEWLAPTLSQLNNIVFLLYLIFNGRHEGVSEPTVAIGSLCGAGLAFLFWYALTAFYYLTYHPHVGVAESLQLAKAAARTLVFPRWALRLKATGANPCFGDALEDADIPLPVGWIANLFPIRGYRWVPDGALYEGHYFSLISALGFFGLYWTLWPLVAPIEMHTASLVALVVEVAVGLALYGAVLAAKLNGVDPALRPVYQRNLRIWKVILAAPILGYTFSIPAIYFLSDAERFPTFALILIVLISMTWFFGALAFFADRYRIPVLTVFLVLLLAPRIFHWTGIREEHYFSVKLMDAPVTLPTPDVILQHKLATQQKGADDRPATLIVVTSTGGGIHAAGWTAAVLGKLEAEFADHSLGSFHDHVLLMSTVSGGSAGLYAYLRELDPHTNDGSPDWDRATIGAECSSLEAIGWGLIYYDLPKAVLPFFPAFVKPSSGVNDLQDGPLGKDRTWGLRRAMLRNLNDSFCGEASAVANPEHSATAQLVRKQVLKDQNANPDNDLKLSLSMLSPMNEQESYPAFTMNTTTVDQGARFLLANYQAPPNDYDLIDKVSYSLAPQQAESFLAAYHDLHPAGSNDARVADLPLATAAQLSATFPYVSSAATFPETDNFETAHFVDGGYYDNDGTASAIEFIRAALEKTNPRDDPSKKIRVLLVEIRNSKDPVYGLPENQLPTPVEDNSKHGCKAWNLVDQLSAPLKAFYGAGHESVTDRNRNGLVLLELAYRNSLDLRHFIIDDTANGDDVVACTPAKAGATDPLNWSLTPHQQREIETSAEGYSSTYEQIRTCFAQGAQCPPSGVEATTQVAVAKAESTKGTPPPAKR